MHFGENQLSPSLIGLSPLPTAHPPGFQPWWVRSSTRSSRASTWPWVDHSASGLEHATRFALFGLAFATATPHGLTSPRTTNSQAHSSKGTQSPPHHKATTSTGLPLTTDLSPSPPPRQKGQNGPTTPNTQPLPGITCVRFSLNPLSLATTHGITVVFSSCGY